MDEARPRGPRPPRLHAERDQQDARRAVQPAPGRGRAGVGADHVGRARRSRARARPVDDPHGPRPRRARSATRWRPRSPAASGSPRSSEARFARDRPRVSPDRRAPPPPGTATHGRARWPTTEPTSRTRSRRATRRAPASCCTPPPATVTPRPRRSPTAARATSARPMRRPRSSARTATSTASRGPRTTSRRPRTPKAVRDDERSARCPARGRARVQASTENQTTLPCSSTRVPQSPASRPTMRNPCPPGSSRRTNRGSRSISVGSPSRTST